MLAEDQNALDYYVAVTAFRSNTIFLSKIDQIPHLCSSVFEKTLNGTLVFVDGANRPYVIISDSEPGIDPETSNVRPKPH